MQRAAEQRILLFRPASGLSDILAELGAACRHGERFGRKVIVEGDFASARHYKDAFSNYFVSTDPNLVLDAAPYRDLFDRLDVEPAHLFGRVSAYVAEWDPEEHHYVDAETRAALTIDLKQDYPAQLLVHHAAGGRGPALQALGRLRLGATLLDELQSRLRAIGRPYAAIHIRNTDLETNYAAQIEPFASAVEGPLFVATDDRRALEFARSRFGRERVHSFADLPARDGQRLHRDAPAGEAFARNRDAILDLVMLALAQQLWILRIEPSVYAGAYSSFSTLAVRLKQTPAILQGLLRPSA